MANNQFVDLNGLRTFKTRQDQYNLEHFASLSGGKVTAEQLPSFVDDVIEGYTTKNAETGAVTFYSDSAKTQPITGETGKIYVDLAATIDGSYRFSGSQFVEIGTSVSTADKAVNDANGNPIITTYATKDELGTAATTAATKNSLGVVQIGDNIDVAAGVISVATATSDTLGVVITGTNIDNNNGVISVATASDSVIGLAKAGTNVNVDATGTFSVNTATAAQSGVVQIGSNISVDNGVISLSSSNVTSALGYTPVNAAELSAISTSDIEGLFA